ncbi:unnamed protein product [Rhizophagus irregularis]|nr:unnamed protein product [Rhizophagus irregularis]
MIRNRSSSLHKNHFIYVKSTFECNLNNNNSRVFVGICQFLFFNETLGKILTKAALQLDAGFQWLTLYSLNVWEINHGIMMVCEVWLLCPILDYEPNSNPGLIF